MKDKLLLAVVKELVLELAILPEKFNVFGVMQVVT